MANETEVPEVHVLDGGQFAWDSFAALSEAGIVGTLVDVGLTALSTLPVVVVTATLALPVSLAIAVAIAMIGVRNAYSKNRE